MKPAQIQDMALSDLKPAPYNPRKIDESALAGLTKSLERFGYVEPIIWNKRTGYVVGGHQRLKVLKTAKVKSVPVMVVDLDDTDEKALNVALNNPHTSGEFTADLGLLLEEIRGADEMLFRELRLDQLITEGAAPPALLGDPDDVPEPPKVARTKPGDLYILGNHRLLCGDSTSADDVKRLLGNERVDSLVTDPPYGVDYSAKNAEMNTALGGSFIKHKDIANDVDRDYRKWFAEWLALIPWAEYATFYIAMSSLELHKLRFALDDCGLTWGDYLVWVKDRLVPGRKDYNSRHEFILYGWPERHKFFGPTNAATTLEYRRPHRSDLHPTMKPVELFKQLIGDGSPAGAIVLDLFGGSGTTLIACEQTSRRARLMELDPLYCDVIVDRWQTLTGKTAKLADPSAAA